jgi:ketosteroid isomerase-like protein
MHRMAAGRTIPEVETQAPDFHTHTETSMIAEPPSSIDSEAELKELTHCWAEALRTKNLATLRKFYAEDAVFFDAAPPLHTAGLEAYARNIAEWFASWPGPIGFELKDLRIHVSGDFALGHSLTHLFGPRNDMDDTDVWMRATIGWRRIDGAWRIIHEHSSVPSYMEPPFKAALDLKP